MDVHKLADVENALLAAAAVGNAQLIPVNMGWRRMREDPIIFVLTQENPKRLGSDSYKRFAQYENGITVSEYFRRGGKPADIHWDLARRYIRLDLYAPLPSGTPEG